MAKLENCAQYYRWSVRDRLCHLKASLEGHAGQVLWGLAPQASEAEIVQLLRNRFGNVNQMERFRAELRTRRRKNGESMQSVYQRTTTNSCASPGQRDAVELVRQLTPGDVRYVDDRIHSLGPYVTSVMWVVSGSPVLMRPFC